MSVERQNCSQHRFLLMALATLSLTIGCTLKKPAKEYPAPSSQDISKSFFFHGIPSSGTVSITKATRHKTFLCGFATESLAGNIAENEMIAAYPSSMGCNVEFEITEHALIGYQVNVSQPKDRSRWKQLIAVPILEHYYLEPELDPNGRQTNRTIKNSTRSHWSRRPYISLEFSRLAISDYAYSLMFEDKANVERVDDIEWDFKNNFLAFSVQATGSSWGSELQGTFRFNFLAFETDKDFQRHLHSPENNMYLNPITILGFKKDGWFDTFHLARWDFGPNKDKTYEVVLNGFPDKKYEAYAQEMLDGWNRTLTKVLRPQDHKAGRTHAFFKVAEGVKLSHYFDLRHPSITWVDDRQLSSGPLGIAYQTADMRNGKILWGGFTVYGGLIEDYISGYMPASSGSSAKSKEIFSIDSRVKILPEKDRHATSGVAALDVDSLGASVQGFAERFIPLFSQLMISSFAGQEQKSSQAMAQPAAESSQLMQKQIKLMMDEVAKTFPGTVGADGLSAAQKMALISASQMYGKALNDAALKLAAGKDLANYTNINLGSGSEYLRKTLMHMNPGAYANQKSFDARRAYAEWVYLKSNSGIFDADRTMDQMDGWRTGLAERMSSGQTVDRRMIMKNILKSLMAHEFGHVLGLGHNFKGNYLPSAEVLPENARKKHLAHAEAEHPTYSSTVMEYMHPSAEIYFEDSQTEPGFHDEQALQYIYNRKYPSGMNKEDYVYSPLEGHGIIPEKNAFLPACNDVYASMGDDPYCNRHDRGSRAEQMVQSYFDDMKDNLIHTLIASSDTRPGFFDNLERRLFISAMTRFGRARVFYDYMRLKYRRVFEGVAFNEQALYDFARACDPNRKLSYPIWNDPNTGLFAKNPGLEELCRVNHTVLDNFRFFLGLKGLDHTDLDLDQRYMMFLSAGESRTSASWEKFLGSWKQLSVFPLKLAALYSLTSPMPVHMMGSYIVPVYTYTDVKARYSFLSMYPEKVTAALATNVRNNVNLGMRPDDVDSGIGLSAVYMFGFINSMLYETNDNNSRFHPHYLENISKQNRLMMEHSPHISVVVMTPMRNQDSSDENLYHYFNSYIWDSRWQKDSPLGENRSNVQAYLLPGAQVLLSPPSNTLLLPISNLTWAGSRSMAFMVAVSLVIPEYKYKMEATLSDSSYLSEVLAMRNEALSFCLNRDTNGKENGLSHYFTTGKEEKDETENKLFSGFLIKSRIADYDGVDHLNEFHQSIQSEFNKYYAYYAAKGMPVDPSTCIKAIRASEIAFLAAAAPNGYFFPQLWNNMAQGL